ncbi:MAG TPA: hypothetical protein VFW53_02820 [Gallionella sp.]|nr:hypothetical protein [Gallionella sp.]
MMISSISYLPSSAVDTTQAPSAVAQQSSTATQQNTQANSTASAIVKLSSTGQAAASLTDLRDKATALKSLSAPPTALDFKVIVQSFVQSFNSVAASVKDWAAKQRTASAENNSPYSLKNINKDTNNAAANSLASLQQYGISQQANGTYSVNQKQLDKSYQDNRSGTLNAVSNAFNRVSQIADKQFSSMSLVGNNAGNFGARANNLYATGIANSNYGASNYGTIGNFANTQNNFQWSSPMTSLGGYAARSALNSYASISSL